MSGNGGGADKYCCDKFREAIGEDIELMNTNGNILLDDSPAASFNVLGCCGQCYVIRECTHCPWCGTKI